MVNPSINQNTPTNLFRQGQREKYYVGSECWELVHFFYKFDAQTGVAKNLRQLPFSVIKPDNTIATISHYHYGNAVYILGFDTAGDTQAIFKITEN